MQLRYITCTLLAALSFGCGGSGKPAGDKPDAGGWVKAPGGIGYNLDRYKGKNPVLLIHTPNTQDGNYQKLMKDWPQVQAEAQKRNLVVIELVGDASGRVWGGELCRATPPAICMTATRRPPLA